MAATSADVVVLGGGPAGLAAAWRAARSGRSVVLLEREPAVGGMAGSFEVAGVRVDHGSHRLHPATPPHLMADLHQLLGSDLQTRPRHGRLRIADRWVGFPLSARELATGLPPRLVLGISRDAVMGPVRRARADTYAEVLRAGLGPTILDALYAPYARKLWGLPPQRIAGEQARRRVSADTPWKVAARVLRGGRGSGQGSIFHYPRRGFGQIVEALADAAVAAGAEIQTSVGVENLDVESGVSSWAGGGQVAAGHVLSTLPLPVLGRLATPPAPPAALAAASALRFRAMVLLYLVHEGGRWTEFDAHYLPDTGTPAARVSEPANYRVSAEDPRDHSVVCVELPCAVGDDVWSASDETLAERVTADLQARGLPALRLTGQHVRRLPRVYPVYEVGYERHLAALDAWASGLARVTTFGRLGLFVHDNTHHALAMAYEAVAALDGSGRRNDTAWSAARDRFAAHVVED